MTTTITPQASPTKLRSGEWGAKVQTADIHEGQAIEITTKGGKSWTATVTKVVWRGDGVAIVATGQRARPADAYSHQGYRASRRPCKTGGNCSSFNSGRSCGGYDCDGWE